MTAGPKRRTTVFLNIPYDAKFERLYLAFIAGLTGLGLDPRCVLEIPPQARAWNRLDRIVQLLQSCDASIHDLSRVERSHEPPRCPRFNMPFELGLAVGLSQLSDTHRWFVFEAKAYRLQKSLSDLNGFDPFVHEGTPEGVMRALTNAFVADGPLPAVDDLMELYRAVRSVALAMKRRDGTKVLFMARHFRELVVASREIAARRSHQV
ncbi:MAG: hypothetical protein HY699_15235 [Deltaproteobacteria bacterium]|nr:hypothetical protein [Deltaproteobacteria bacterium]